jgi:hypothetical protein
VFGSAADEIFMAWHVARFVQQVASAGPCHVPLLVNAWIVQHPGEAAGSYPSGGPIAGMIDIWRLAAPAITAYGCDIYTDDFAAVCADYHQRGNPLLIPEHRRENQLAAKCWYAFGQHDALAFAPFGIESLGCGQTPSIDGAVAAGTTAFECGQHGADLVRQTYALLRGLLPAIDDLLGTPRCVGLLQTSDAATTVTIGGWSFRCHWLAPYDRAGPGAGGLIASPRDGTFIVAGYSFRLEPLAPPWEFLGLQAGTWNDGTFITTMHLNGDEGGIRLGSAPGCRRFRMRCIG